MPTRASKRRKDPNQSAFDVLQRVIESTEATAPAPAPTLAQQRSAAAAILSKLGASKGGHARARSLTAKKRAEIAKKAAASRWAKRRKG